MTAPISSPRSIVYTHDETTSIVNNSPVTEQAAMQADMENPIAWGTAPSIPLEVLQSVRINLLAEFEAET